LIELFLHGPQQSVPDVQVVWRADLDDGASDEEWSETAKLCPPSSREAMPVPIRTFRKWFSGEEEVDDQQSDLSIGVDEAQPDGPVGRRALVWRGDESKSVKRSSEVRPGQTIILPLPVPPLARSWDELGHIPAGVAYDVGDRAAFEVRRGVSLRLHHGVMNDWRETPALGAVKKYASQDDAEWDQMKDRLMTYFAELDADASKPWPHEFLSELKQERLRVKLITYPGKGLGYVLEARRIIQSSRRRGERVLLEDHLTDVEAEVERMAAGLDDTLKQALKAAAKFHDYGKVDVRYQAWLLGGDLMAAQYEPKPVAKSGSNPVGRQEAVGLPKGFRHELLSLMFSAKSGDVEGETRDLALHLVASHHGRCRPLAPVIPDGNADCVCYGGTSICKQERFDGAPHRLDSGVADRFWRLARRYGWWGLAYLEALFRLADWRASEAENGEVSE